jgi:hypothetical protein
MQPGGRAVCVCILHLCSRAHCGDACALYRGRRVGPGQALRTFASPSCSEYVPCELKKLRAFIKVQAGDGC